MLDVEVVVLDERIHRAGERQALFERRPRLLGEECTVFSRDALTLGEYGGRWARDVLACFELSNVRPDGGNRQSGVVDPGAYVVVEAVPVREVEPRVFRLVEVGEPSRPGLGLRHAGSKLVFVRRALDMLRHADLQRKVREALQLLIRS